MQPKTPLQRHPHKTARADSRTRSKDRQNMRRPFAFPFKEDTIRIVGDCFVRSFHFFGYKYLCLLIYPLLHWKA